MSALDFEALSLPELEFREEGHLYLLNGLAIPSVTTLMEPLSKKVYGTIDPAVLEAAAQRGTEVHNACENYAAFGIEDIRPEYQGYLDAFKRWCDTFKPEFLGTEVRVYHKILRYAGTADILCKVKGATTLIDLKTTSSLQYMLCGVQLEGYDRAFDSHGVKIEDRAILHLERGGMYGYTHFNERQESWRVISALLTIKNYQDKF